MKNLFGLDFSLIKFKFVFRTNDYTYSNFTKTTAFHKISNCMCESSIYFSVQRIIESKKSEVVIKYEGILSLKKVDDFVL